MRMCVIHLFETNKKLKETIFFEVFCSRLYTVCWIAKCSDSPIMFFYSMTIFSFYFPIILPFNVKIINKYW